MHLIAHASEYLIGTIFVGYIVRRAVADLMIKFLGWLLRGFLVKSKQDMAIWLHHWNKALDKNHQHKLVDCADGNCKII